MNILQHLKRELPAMLRLALPLVAAEVGWMTMGLVDTMMVGRMPNSAQAMGAVGLGDVLFFTVAICGSGVLLGLDTMVSQAFGAGRLEDCHKSLWSAVYLSVPMAAVAMGVVRMIPWLLARVHTNPAVLEAATAYIRVINWCALPLFLYGAFRRYLQSMNLVRPITFALVTANLVNVAGNWVLIYGKLGLPALGVAGSAASTVIARIYLFLVLCGYAAYKTQVFSAFGPPELTRVKTLLRLGLPAAGQMLAEVGVFATSAAMIGQLDAASMAGNQIATNVISLTFMVPLGISAATAVRVGQNIGAGDGRAAVRSAWTALALGVTFMSCSAVTLLVFPQYVVRIYTPDPMVRAFGVQMLIAAAFFQVFDAIQAIIIGALRGAGDTHTAMLTHLLVYWLLGLPVGYILCFRVGWGAMGMWVGLSLGVIVIGMILFLFWQRKVVELKRLVPLPMK